MGTLDPPTIAVAICTYNRNEALTILLEALITSVRHLAGRAAVGVVIVDDSKDGRARAIAEQYAGRFELGTVYRISGRQNISLARNMAIETAMDMADWTVTIDDDCEPVKEWLEALLEVQRQTRADAITGPMIRRVPSGGPSWLVDEPFLELGLERQADGAELTSGSTFNSMIRSAWLKRHAEIRFQPALGVVGGEDMVFYRAARAAGLQIRYSQRACVYENEPPSRANLAYQLRLFLWHGNSSYVACVRSGVRPARMLLHGAKSLVRALLRPIVRICRGQRPQLRYCLASVLHAVGNIIGPLGIRVDHR
jgi:glycosyltransferase involved in cell wall biosynthesis